MNYKKKDLMKIKKDVLADMFLVAQNVVARLKSEVSLSNEDLRSSNQSLKMAKASLEGQVNTANRYMKMVEIINDDAKIMRNNFINTKTELEILKGINKDLEFQIKLLEKKDD